jgi:hypothetical protein
MLDSLRRLRLFNRAARLERDLEATKVAASVEESKLDGRLQILERDYRETAYCVKCGGSFLIPRMRFFLPRGTKAPNGQGALLAPCCYCAGDVRLRAGAEVKEPWRQAPEPSEQAS